MTNSRDRISIAVSALGGQGGGVLSNWIVELAEANGYRAQYTAIAGVAQRTGTTIYAIEIYPENNIKDQEPVLALMPVSGDVDICIAAELMEAGRAVNRGIVTQDRTTLIASDHRVFAISEKENMGDGRLDSDAVRDAIKKAAKNLILFDMNEMVLKSSSVISSVLFGALAGSGALPFKRETFEATIKKSGRAVESNLAGFELGFNAAQNGSIEKQENQSPVKLLDSVKDFPEEARAIITYGVHKLVDYQDVEYADEYLAKLEGINDPTLLTETARHLALWMSFEDIIRVADLKTRVERNEKISSEVRAGDHQIWYGHDFFHPRYEEFCHTLPAGLGQMMKNSAFWKRFFSRFFKKGRIIRPKTIIGYLILRFVASLRGMRRKTLRYKEEMTRINAWLEIVKAKQGDSELALEISKCPRLIKGYGSTHERGINRFSRIMALIENDETITAETIIRIRDAALLSERGIEFNEVLKDQKMTEVSEKDAGKGEFAWAGSS
ncbi:indolepyruvate oxidoreductase subunit beta family protein [Pseudemcibacter aquimaris]|uniref:indolepyruvate oxidoreductase subunit beta family protein n=1 Tax=Pseudemcibacter aquimaris TaxID=2857064 RepID=UPI002012AA28|nr:indolepyruvate oxidoreductase subunit beta family protein [Pseudemcibacter aquimaris]MCC3861558.1 indolepyruvate oxidoreductase subunit beta family protein [Pseudemcibacter aquimaris]WDU58327.1 indolepyruvate oxidoreductase subunit beta family protein [Pseudemcibacter aquimaris]